MTSYNFFGIFKSSHVSRKRKQIFALGAGAAFSILFDISGTALAKTPGKTYCYKNTCHRVKTLNETKALVGRDVKIKASFYDGCSKDRYNSCGLTSSGEVYRPHKPDNAASSVLPDGTIALVWSQLSGEAIVLRINNAGPYWGNRKLDLSAAAARKLGIKGVEEVTLRVVRAPTEDEARFEKNRSYDPVIGPLGKFASLELAQKAMSKIRADGLKGTPSLASLEDTIPVSGSEVKVASLDDSFFVSTLLNVTGERSQSAGSEASEESNISSTPTQSILSPLLRVKDLLFTSKSQNLPSAPQVPSEALIDRDPLEMTTVFSNGLHTVQSTEGSSELEKIEKVSEDYKVNDSTLSYEQSKNLIGKANGSKADQDVSNNNKAGQKADKPVQNNEARQTRSRVKISSLSTGSSDKYSSPKTKKKNT